VSVKKGKVILAPSAERDLRALEQAYARELCRDMVSYLETNPFPIGKPRIKRLSGFSPPLYRLRSGDFRAYYRIREGEVIILAIRKRKDSEQFLKKIKEERRLYRKRLK
jgi:mRNA-degrading endonuclease RelE of RelBE toxin-antitoxin system